MDQTLSISSSRNNDETGMEQVQSDLKALKGLYGLLQNSSSAENLDKASRAYLMKMLDDATEAALLRQAKMISGSLIPPALERNLSTRSDRPTRAAAEPRQTLNPPASPSLSLRQVSQRLHPLNIHHSPSSGHAADEHAVLSRLPFNRSSKIAVMPPRHRTSVEQPNSAASRPRLYLNHSKSSSHRHAAEEPAVLSRIASNRSSRAAVVPPPRHNPSREQPDDSAASRPRLNLHHSASSGRHVHSHPDAVEEPPGLSRLPSNRSSRSAMPPMSFGLSLQRLPVAATSQNGTVTGRSPRADLHDAKRPVYDHSSLERGSTRRSVSRKLSLGRKRLPDHTTARRVVATKGLSSTRQFGRLGSGLSLGMTSSRAGRGVAMATPTSYSSSSASSNNEVATIRSRITPHRRELITERWARRAAAAEEDAVPSVVGRPRGTPKRIDSGSTYTVSASGAASSFTYRGSTVSPASSYSPYSSSPVTRWRGGERPAYSSTASDSSRSRRCRRRRDQERKERREGRLRKLKEKIAMVFHHRHDHHHHHHHHQPRGQESPPPPMSDRCAIKRKSSTWKHLGGLFHHTKGQEKNSAAPPPVLSKKKVQEKKTTSQAVLSVPAKKKKRNGGGGGMSVLLGGLRHLRGKRKAAASGKKMNKMASRVQVKKMNWWQQLRKRHGKPQRRLGFGKAV